MRRGFAGAAVPTTIVGGMTASSPAAGGTFTLAAATGWAFTATPFVVVVDRGEASEEKILCSAIADTIVTVAERGYDGTVAATHAAGAEVIHVLDSLTIDEANIHVSDSHAHTHMVAFRSFVEATPGTASPATVNKPAGVIAGDLLVLVLRQENGMQVSTRTWPSGFTEHDSVQYSLNEYEALVVASKVAGIGEPASYAVEFVGGTALSWSLWCLAFSAGGSVAQVTEYSYGDPFTGITEATVPSLNLPADGGILVFAVEAGGAPSVPTGMTQVDLTGGLLIAYQVRSQGGATGTRSSSFSSSTTVGAIMAGFGVAVGATFPTVAATGGGEVDALFWMTASP